MEIELIVTEDGDRLARHEVKVDGKSVARIYPLCECPEDAIIGRDLIDGNDIFGYIKMGYDAAKRGEELSITERKGDPE